MNGEPAGEHGRCTAPAERGDPAPSTAPGLQAGLQIAGDDAIDRSELQALFGDVLEAVCATTGAAGAGLWVIEAAAGLLRCETVRGLDPTVVAVTDRDLERIADELAAAGCGGSPGIDGDADAPLDAGVAHADAQSDQDRGPGISSAPPVPDTGGEQGPGASPAVDGTGSARVTEGVSPELRRQGISTACQVPVVFHRELLGVLVAYHRETHDWTADELSIVRGRADQLAAAIQNARLHESVATLAGRLRSIQQLTARLGRLRSADRIGEALAEETERLVPYDSIRVYLVDGERGVCEPIACRSGGQHGAIEGAGPAALEHLRVRVGQGLTGWVAEHNEALVIDDATGDGRGIVLTDHRVEESMLLIPVSHEDVVLGVLVLTRHGLRRFGGDDLTTMTIFAGHAAQALVNAVNVERLGRQRGELEHLLESQRRLLEVNGRLLSTLDTRGVLDLIADSLRAVVAHDNLTIYQADRESGMFHAVLARDRYADEIVLHPLDPSSGITGWVVEHGEAQCVNDAHLDPRAAFVPGTPREPESLIVVPLIADGRVAGTLNVGRHGGAESHFTQGDFELTKLFAGQASIALQNAAAHSAVSARAETDAVTGLHNHGAFQRDFDRLLSEADEPFALIMIDLDGFKLFNDTCGHPAGDRLLRSVAAAVGAATRASDIAYRYGGDEFAILLPRAKVPTARSVARRVRHAIGRLESSPIARVTASVGVACHPADAPTKEGLVAAADAALYRAKHLGGDAVVMASRQEPEVRGRTVDRGNRRTPRETAGHEDLAPAQGTAGGRDRDAAAIRGASLASALDDLTVDLARGTNRDAFLRSVVRRACGLLGADDGWVCLAADDGTTLEVRIGLGRFRHDIGLRVSRGDGLAGRVWTTGTTEAVPITGGHEGMPVPGDTRGGDAAHVVGHMIAAPLVAATGSSGVIGLARYHRGRAFGAADARALERLAHLASVALRTGEGDDVTCGRADRPTTGSSAAAGERTWGRMEERSTLLRGKRAIPRPAFLDPLTGYENRAGLADRLARALDRRSPRRVGVLLVDIERLTFVNDTLGHMAGDELILAAGRRIVDRLRPSDVVVRFAGGTFGVLVADGVDRDSVLVVASRLADAFGEPFTVAGRELHPGARIGIRVAEPDESNAEDVLQDAGIALTAAKGDPVRRIVLYSAEMGSGSRDRLDLESELRRACDRDEFVVHYQPIVDLSSGTIVGVEALARWAHPERGILRPEAFISLAEETGLILPLGRQVLGKACRQASDWLRNQRLVPAARRFVLSVNLSPRQFAQPGLVDEVASVLTENDLDPAALRLEITESALMLGSADGPRASIERLREIGVGVVIDDFGVAYSSLSHLQQLPVNGLKVDRTFVTGVSRPGPERSIVEAIVTIARGLGLDTTAEGIETREQLTALRGLGCEQGQGYLYARPLEARHVAALLAAGCVAAA